MPTADKPGALFCPPETLFLFRFSLHCGRVRILLLIQSREHPELYGEARRLESFQAKLADMVMGDSVMLLS
jgi:hypothetical protein